MPLAIVHSRAQLGISAIRVSVEVHLSGGLPSFTIVGLPEAAVKESRERVRAAIINSNFDFPLRRITVNLAPADLPKEGGRFDLPIAIGLLCASDQLDCDSLPNMELIGELGLSGELKAIAGTLPAVISAEKEGCSSLVPDANHPELQHLKHTTIYCAKHLIDACGHISGTNLLAAINPQPSPFETHRSIEDFSDIIGQDHAKRALEIAASGGHHVLMVGSPGSGKTMLANRFNGILPSLTEQQWIESSIIHSIAFGGNNAGSALLSSRPFRSPHHSASATALAGGGSRPKPGEISLAHNGVLFLDEFSEFNRRALEIMREPLESGIITISRAAQCIDYPARFQLIAAMNPCPNGCDIDAYGRCGCSANEIKRYTSRISVPLLDRIDIQLSVPKVNYKDIMQPHINEPSTTHDQIPAENSASIRSRVEKAYQIQIERQGKCNQQLQARELTQSCKLNKECGQLIADAFERLHLTARSYHRILKVARTVADMSNSKNISIEHIAEAISYRSFDQLLNRDRNP